jgi:hypothetical protein
MPERLADTRNSSRYPALRSAVYLGWWEEPEFHTCAAALINVSHGGALVHVGLRPPENTALWLCLAGSPPSEWTEVSVITCESPIAGLFQVRLQFSQSCPYDVFKAAVHGMCLTGEALEEVAGLKTG